MYVFGDSLSDTGNVSLATVGLGAGIAALCRPQFQQWTGLGAGPCAVDSDLPALQPSLAGGTDFAYGGAETGQTSMHTLNPTDLPSQFGSS